MSDPAASDPASILDALLTLWRTTRSAEVGELLRAVTSARPALGLVGKTRRERRLHWNALWSDGNATDIPRLLSSLVSFGRKEATQLLDSLARSPADPRTADAMLDLLERPPDGFLGYRATGFWDRVLSLAATNADASHRGRTARIPAALDVAFPNPSQLFEHLSQEVVLLAHRIESIESRDLDADEMRELASLRSRSRSVVPSATVQPLFAAVYAQPHDDAPRLVLADALQETGDPRGKLIAYQLLPKRVRAHERKLIAEHGPGLLGELADCLKKVKFERGFPIAATIALDAALPHADALAWATLRELRCISYVDPSPLLNRAPLTSLKRLVARRGTFATLERTLAIDELVIDRIDSSAIAELAKCSLFPKLRSLHLQRTDGATAADVAKLWEDGAIGASLTTLGLHSKLDIARSVALIDGAPPFDKLVTKGPRLRATVDRLCANGWRWRFEVAYPCPPFSAQLAAASLQHILEIEIVYRRGARREQSIDAVRAAVERSPHTELIVRYT